MPPNFGLPIQNSTFDLIKTLAVCKLHFFKLRFSFELFSFNNFLQLLGTLEQIEVIQNGIQYEGIKALADCIKHSPNLKILNLNDNIMTPKGAIAIAEVFLKNGLIFFHRIIGTLK